MSGFLVSKRNYEDFTEGAAISGGSIAGMAGYSKLRRMKGLKGPVSFKGGLLAAGAGGVGASLASREAFKRRKGKTRELAQYRASVGKSLTLNSIAKEHEMNNKFLVAKAIRDLDEVSKAFKLPSQVGVGKPRNLKTNTMDGKKLYTRASRKAAAPIQARLNAVLPRTSSSPFSRMNMDMGMKPMANPFNSLTGGPKRVLKSLDEVEFEKGFLTPVKGIRGGFMTRRFPDFTSSGKRQLATKKAQRASDSAMDTSAFNRANASKPFDSGKYYRDKNASVMAERRASSARIKASQPSGRQSDPKFNAADR